MKTPEEIKKALAMCDDLAVGCGDYCPYCGAKMEVEDEHQRYDCDSYNAGHCMGTRECDPCSCNGDMRYCTYYPEKIGEWNGGEE